MKKKLIALVLALVMVFSMSVTAFAAAAPADQAVTIALKNAKLSKAQVKKLKVKKDGKHYEVEFVRKSNSAEYDYEISLTGTKIVEKQIEYKYRHNSSKKKIGVVAARKKVAKFSGISVSKIKTGTCTYKYSDREGIYTFKFVKGNYKYEFDVLAPTGTITEWEKELIKIKK